MLIFPTILRDVFLYKESLDAVARQNCPANTAFMFYAMTFIENSRMLRMSSFCESYPDLADRCIVTNSFSKPAGNDGLRFIGLPL